MSRGTSYKFLTKLKGVKLVSNKAPVQTLICSGEAPRATVSSEKPFCKPGKFSFAVFMRQKDIKTAVGFLSQNKTTEYMKDTPIGEPHVSFGGAGWIHPQEVQAKFKYKTGDTVKAEVDFDSSVVRFYVNGEVAGEDKWESTTAYPALSFDGGPCELDITIEE